MTVFPFMQSHRRFVCASFFLMFGAFFPGSSIPIRAQNSSPRTTLVVYADHKLGIAEWTALTSEVERSRSEYAAEYPRLGEGFDAVQGDEIEPGIRIQNSIAVYLHGECNLMPSTKHVVQGALGWVPVVQGRIQPFIHVSCERIEEMLGPLALGMHQQRRDKVMAEAIARVILHEWIHFAAQTTGHVEHGITKSQFLVSDLLADDTDRQPQRRHNHHETKRQSGL